LKVKTFVGLNIGTGPLCLFCHMYDTQNKSFTIILLHCLQDVLLYMFCLPSFLYKNIYKRKWVTEILFSHCLNCDLLYVFKNPERLVLRTIGFKDAYFSLPNVVNKWINVNDYLFDFNLPMCYPYIWSIVILNGQTFNVLHIDLYYYILLLISKKTRRSI
jgi:hypothetical protein